MVAVFDRVQGKAEEKQEKMQQDSENRDTTKSYTTEGQFALGVSKPGQKVKESQSTQESQLDVARSLRSSSSIMCNSYIIVIFMNLFATLFKQRNF